MTTSFHILSDLIFWSSYHLSLCSLELLTVLLNKLHIHKYRCNTCKGGGKNDLCKFQRYSNAFEVQNKPSDHSRKLLFVNVYSRTLIYCSWWRFFSYLALFQWSWVNILNVQLLAFKTFPSLTLISTTPQRNPEYGVWCITFAAAWREWEYHIACYQWSSFCYVGGWGKTRVEGCGGVPQESREIFSTGWQAAQRCVIGWPPWDRKDSPCSCSCWRSWCPILPCCWARVRWDSSGSGCQKSTGLVQWVNFLIENTSLPHQLLNPAIELASRNTKVAWG